jgi:putative tryptophan/tyrosine transport system substrate-binding protein
MQQVMIALLLLFAIPLSAAAQDASNKIPVIGWLSPATLQSYSQGGPDNPGPHQLRDALSKHGLIDGKTIRVDMRLAEGKLERLPELAETVVREGATVILAFGEAAGRAAQAATKTVPIVCVADDLVDSGLGTSLAGPGSNVTGVSILATELDAKKIELLKELLPSAKRLGVLNDPATSGSGAPTTNC